jgi:signal transduction histidine kinase
MKRGLLLRTALASGLLAVLVGGGFAVLIVAIGDLRHTAELGVESRARLVAADGLEKLVVDLETGVRGFALTGKDRFLEPWRTARAAFPQQATRLAQLGDSPEQATRVRQIARAGNAYIADYAVPLIATARRDLPRAQTVAATDEGKRRVDALREQFTDFRTAERATLGTIERQNDLDARRAVTAASVGLGGSILLIVLYGTYLSRAIVLPVRGAAGMAGRLAGGDLSVRMPAQGVGEMGELERSFNTMAGSLQASHDELRQLADEQAALRRVATLVASAVSPTEAFAAVALDARRLLGADAGRVFRYEPGDTAVVVANSSGPDAEIAVGTSVPLAAGGVPAEVLRTGRPAVAREMGIRAAAGAPIVVEGRLWGMVGVVWADEERASAAAADRLAQFTDLVATAIANADSRAELLASRARVVAAGDDARRRVVRDLHDGAQQRLVHTVIALKLALSELRSHDAPGDTHVADALDQAQRANAELRELAHGILPAVLTRGGLRAGVDALVSRTVIPVSADVAAGPLPEEIEASAYFVVAEALTNVVKHSHAESAAVRAWVDDGALRIEVRDDGIGGAHPDGSGLLGLTDRLAALGGRLRVDSPRGGGTLVAATMPLRP